MLQTLKAISAPNEAVEDLPGQSSESDFEAHHLHQADGRSYGSSRSLDAASGLSCEAENQYGVEE